MNLSKKRNPKPLTYVAAFDRVTYDIVLLLIDILSVAFESYI